MELMVGGCRLPTASAILSGKSNPLASPEAVKYSLCLRFEACPPNFCDSYRAYTERMRWWHGVHIILFPLTVISLHKSTEISKEHWVSAHHSEAKWTAFSLTWISELCDSCGFHWWLIMDILVLFSAPCAFWSGRVSLWDLMVVSARKEYVSRSSKSRVSFIHSAFSLGRCLLKLSTWPRLTAGGHVSGEWATLEWSIIFPWSSLCI